MVEMLNWKEALKHLTDNDLYTNDEYLTGNLEVNAEQTQEMYEYPFMKVYLNDQWVNPQYYQNDYQLDINEVIESFKYTTVTSPYKFKIQFENINNYKYFGIYFTNVYLAEASVEGIKNNITIQVTCNYEYEGKRYNGTLTYWIYTPTNYFGKVNQYIDFNWLNTHVVDVNTEPHDNIIIPEGAQIISCNINSIEFYLVNDKNTGYLDFYSPDTDKIILSTNRLYDLIYNTNHTTRFTEETDELTRRLISKGVLADALFAEEVKCKNRWSQIFNKISETQDEYSKLIKIQQDNIATITDAIKNVTTIKFNDTPQTSNDFTGNEFNSTITTTESEVQLGSLADKLEIAKKALSDLYDSWIDNFKTFYIY